MVRENFFSWAHMWAECGRGSRFQTLVKIECSVGLLEAHLKSPETSAQFGALLEPMHVYLEL